MTHGSPRAGQRSWSGGGTDVEILVRLVDRSAAESDSKRGDVVTVQADGWEWSQAERTSPDWLIIKTAGLLATDRDTLIACAQNFPLGKFRRREWRLDLDNAPLPGRFAWPRVSESVTMTRVALVSILKRKPAMT